MQKFPHTAILASSTVPLSSKYSAS